MNILEKLKEKGYDTIPAEFYSQIDLWKSWYDGNVKDFHDYCVFNGQRTVQCRRYSMGMGKKVAEDWANLLMNEKVSVTLEGEKEQGFFDSVCKANNFEVKANEMQEMKAGLGTTAYVARVSNVTINEGTGEITGGGEIKLDYVTAHNIFPILHDVLEELARIILRLGNSVLHLGLNENVEISIDFDDSIIEDKVHSADLNRQLREAMRRVRNGVNLGR